MTEIHQNTNRFIVGAAIGSGSTAIAAESAGCDILLAINAGRLRSMGAPSIACMLPIFQASRLTRTFAVEEILPQCSVPVLLGLNCFEEERDLKQQAKDLRSAGFAGAVNFPTSMHYSKSLQQILSRAGRGMERELETLLAVKAEGLMTMFYCADRTHARLAADAGIDLICLNLGWNVGGRTGHQRRQSIEEVAVSVRDIGRLIKRINPDVKFLLEGGPIVTSDDLARLIRIAPVDGYVGGSTFERMPLEESVAKQIDDFRRAGTDLNALSKDYASLAALAARHGFYGKSQPLLRFMRRLKSIARGRSPILLRLGPGQEPSRAVAALAGMSPQGDAVYHLDIQGEDYPARARALLFGRGEEGRAESALRPGPLLSDEKIDWIVFRGAEYLPAGLQRRLARALTENSFRPSGQRRTAPLRPRLLFVTTDVAGNAANDVAGLDQNLAQILNPVSVQMPRLVDRVDDLEDLIEAYSAEMTLEPLTRDSFSAEAFRLLRAHSWTGNEAELRATLGRLSDGTFERPYQPEAVSSILNPESERPVTGRTEKDRIIQALWQNGFRRGRTATALGMSRKTLYLKIKKYGIGGPP